MTEVIEMDVMALIEQRNPLLAETMEDHRNIGESCQAGLPGGSESRNDEDDGAEPDCVYDDPDAGNDPMQIDGETLQMAWFGIPGVDF